MVHLLGNILQALETNDDLYFGGVGEYTVRIGTHSVFPCPFGLSLAISMFKFHYFPLIGLLTNLAT